MNAVEPRHSPEEFKEWGDRIYDEQIRQNLTPEDRGKLVAIDIEGRGHEVAENERAACGALRARIPDAQIWIKRVGYAAVNRLGRRGTFGGHGPRHTTQDAVRYPLGEFSRRGNAVFERIADQVRSANPKDFIAIDIETGEFEVAPEQLVAISRLRGRSRDPNPQIWTRRVGSDVAHRVGGRKRPEFR